MKNKVPIVSVKFFNGIYAFQSNQEKWPENPYQEREEFKWSTCVPVALKIKIK